MQGHRMRLRVSHETKSKESRSYLEVARVRVVEPHWKLKHGELTVATQLINLRVVASHMETAARAVALTNRRTFVSGR